MLTAEIYGSDGGKIAEITTDGVVLGKEQDALDLMVAPALAGARRIIVHRDNLSPEFFDLRTGLAGAILQKFVTYQVKLAVVGDFSGLSENFKAFIDESNRGGQFMFAPDAEAALAKLSQT